MLTCDTSRAVYLIPRAGTWSRDHVAAVTDHGLPDAEGFITRTDQEPDRNLYQLVSEEYRYIGLEVVAMVCDRLDGVANELARRAQARLIRGGISPDLSLRYLGEVVTVTGSDALDYASRTHVGEGWMRQYENSKKSRDEWQRD